MAGLTKLERDKETRRTSAATGGVNHVREGCIGSGYEARSVVGGQKKLETPVGVVRHPDWRPVSKVYSPWHLHSSHRSPGVSTMCCQPLRREITLVTNVEGSRRPQESATRAG